MKKKKDYGKDVGSPASSGDADCSIPLMFFEPVLGLAARGRCSTEPPPPFPPVGKSRLLQTNTPGVWSEAMQICTS